MSATMMDRLIVTVCTARNRWMDEFGGEYDPPSDQDFDAAIARAVLRELSEPTPDMVHAMHVLAAHYPERISCRGGIESVLMAKLFEAAVSAVLEEPPHAPA